MADQPPMTPAEFKALREHLGLTTRWLAHRWKIQETTIQRWERNRTVPAPLAADLADLADQFAAQVTTLRRSRHRDLPVPRRDTDSPDTMPATWHRAIALTAAHGTRHRLIWKADPTDLES